MYRVESKRVIWGLVVFFCIVLLLTADFGLERTLLFDEIFNFGHIPLFGLVAIIFLWILHKGSWPSDRKNEYITAGVLTIILGLVTEIIQLFMPNRFFQTQDVLYDALGTVTFLVLMYPFPESYRGKKYFKCLSLIILCVAATPIFPGTLDTWHMYKEFPVLASFETPLEMKRWSTEKSTATRSDMHTTGGEYSLKVDLLPGIYPGVSLDYLLSDWRGYRSISIDIFVEGMKDLKMTIQIHDKEHNKEPEDRFNKSFVLSSGQNHISIVLEDIVKAPKNRVMDIRKITNMILFADELHEKRVVYMDNLRLKK